LFGAEVLDEDLAQVAPRLAAAQAAFLGEVYGLRLSDEGRVQAIVRRGGQYRWVEAEGPSVAAVRKDSNRPRYAPAPRLITVYSSPGEVEIVTLETLEITEDDLRPRVERRGEAFPPEREMGVVAEGTVEKTAARVASELRRLSHGS
jgi:electron transfer flavoprotein alpha/beta subunit